ncbi:MAG TPA: phosphoribosyltransferase family protein [Thermodesulfovibrionales bacterium]|nr:phosphoribosyltransferase family protein [Thermodesulfovibrionales bacterium]
MAKLKEDPLLKDKVSVFEDRKEAGKRLAEYLAGYKDTDAIVLALPSGGVPVAAEIASALDLPLDLLIVRKVQIPDNPEAGFGAIGPDGEVFLNRELMKHLRLTEQEISIQIEKTRAIIGKRNRIFRKERPFPSVKNMVAIVVDDGLASGYTMLSAVRFLRKMSPQTLVAAVPTGSKKTVEALVPEVDELFCLNVRSGTFFAVADAYRKWHDLTDEGVLSLLKYQDRKR